MKKHVSFVMRVILATLAFAVLILCLVPIRFNAVAHIVLLPFENRFQKRIDFEESRIWLPVNIFLENACVIDKNGRLYSFREVDIDYNIAKLLFKKMDFTFDLKDVKLYQDVGLFDSVADMLIIKAMPDIEFNEIKGAIALRKNGIFIENLCAHNSKMKINGKGWIDNNGAVDGEVNFSFSKEVTDTIPDVVKITLLKNEDKDWMGIALKIKGNFKKPTLRISSDTLKLNIIEKFK
jgi:hypothetical protein